VPSPAHDAAKPGVGGEVTDDGEKGREKQRGGDDSAGYQRASTSEDGGPQPGAGQPRWGEDVRQARGPEQRLGPLAVPEAGGQLAEG
jgi:hypothetical protein